MEKYTSLKKIVPVILLVAVVFAALGLYVFEKKSAPVSLPETMKKKSAITEGAYLSEPPAPIAPAAAIEERDPVASAEPTPMAATPSITVKKITEKRATAELPLEEIKCQESETSSVCYDRFYREIVLAQSTNAAFSDVKRRYETSGFVKAECHQLAHTIGRTAVTKYPDISEAYAHGDSFCWSGYYHGVVEAFIQKVGKDNLAQGNGINEICRPLREKSPYSFDHYNCVHGLGHGLMYIHSNELFESLKICDALTDSWERTSCWGGVYMENIMIDNKNHFTKFLKPEDPLYPCNAVEDKYKEQCYLMQTSYMLRVRGGSFSEVFNLCSTVPPPYNVTCYQSLGRDASGQTASDAVRTKEYCLLGKDYVAQSNCVIGAVKDFISYHHSDVQAKAFCGMLPENLLDVCFSTAKSYYQIF